MRIGIDLGGTKIEAVALDQRGDMLARRRMPTPAGDYSGTLRAIAELVFGIEREFGQTGTVGVATPGALSALTGLMKNSNSTVLNGKPLDGDLGRTLGRPVRTENDANCLAISEAVDGAAAGAKVVFGAILGTGVGGGLVVDRQIASGRNRIAGEWGHNPLPWPREQERPGAPCYCGKAGCIETFLSGGGLAREYGARTGEVLTAEEIAAAADHNEAARQAVGTHQDRLARALATVINLIDPDIIVLGGGISNIGMLYRGLPDLIARYAFSDGITTPVVPALHGDSSGVRGAAWLWPEG